jgi:hypothetical protein
MRAHASVKGGGGAGVNTINEDNSCNDEAEKASFLFRLDHERVHTSAKGAPSAGVETVDDADSYNDNVASAGQFEDRGCEPEIAGGSPLKKARSGEASSLFRLDRIRAHASAKGGGSTGVDTVNEDNSYDKEDNNIASNGRQKMGQGLNNLADWASDGRPKTRPPKAPTRSGRGATVGTRDNNVSSGGVLPSASNDKFASKERGHEPGDNEAARAAVFGMRRVVASAGGGTAAVTRGSTDGTFVALLGDNNVVAASAGQPDSYARCHKNVEAVGVASGARQVAAVARDGPADGLKPPAVDRTDGNARRHKSVEAAGAAFGARQVAATAWDGPAAGTKRPAGNRLTCVANEEAPPLSTRCPGGSATHGERKAAARAGPRNSIEPNDEASVKQAVDRRYPKWADGRARDPQAEAWCQAKRDDKEASYTASQRESKHAAHQGGGTRSPQGLTALFGLTASSGVLAYKKIKGKTGQGVNSAAIFSQNPNPDPNQLLPTSFSSVALFELTAADNFQGRTGQHGSAANFFPVPGIPVQKKGRISPWRLWAELQPPPVGGVITHIQRFSGENWPAWKRCQFFLGPGMPVQKRGCYSPWHPWAEPQQPPVRGVIAHIQRFSGENRRARKHC